MEITRGFTFLVSTTSRWMSSEAEALPPGLFTRSTTALTRSSRRRRRSSRLSRSPPIWLDLPSPSTISPSATSTAMRVFPAFASPGIPA